MFNSLKILAIRIINRILLILRFTKFTGNQTKNVLISYVTIPRCYIPFYFKSSHNHKIQCFLLARYLNQCGYTVYVHDYLNDKDINYSLRYDIFIGHNVTFHDICKRINSDAKKILIATGSEPTFGNSQQRLRIRDVNNRRKSDLKVYDDNIVPDLTKNYEIADEILLMGNNFVKSTYPATFSEKIALVNNVTLHPFFERRSNKRTNSFLFISSVGQIHRGLDLLLEIFRDLDEKLYILSAFSDETDFVKLYEKELYSRKNIIPIGFIPLESQKFRDTVNECDFVILPSCSEGQSSSVINLMAYGLIPVVTDNTGIQNVELGGIKIKHPDIESVRIAVQTAVSLSDEELEKKRQLLKIQNNDYTTGAFVKRLAELIN